MGSRMSRDTNPERNTVERGSCYGCWEIGHWNKCVLSERRSKGARMLRTSRNSGEKKPHDIRTTAKNVTFVRLFNYKCTLLFLFSLAVFIWSEVIVIDLVDWKSNPFTTLSELSLSPFHFDVAMHSLSSLFSSSGFSDHMLIVVHLSVNFTIF